MECCGWPLKDTHHSCPQLSAARGGILTLPHLSWTMFIIWHIVTHRLNDKNIKTHLTSDWLVQSSFSQFLLLHFAFIHYAAGSLRFHAWNLSLIHQMLPSKAFSALVPRNQSDWEASCPEKPQKKSNCKLVKLAVAKEHSMVAAVGTGTGWHFCM